MSRRWTSAQARALLDSIGSFGWSVLERKTDHSKREIWDRVRRAFGGGGVTRGSYSLRQAMGETGYSRSQLDRAAEALNQRWQRTARGGNYLITAEQLEDMAAWLSDDFWSRKHHLYNCIDCATKERPHHAMGMCLRCYRRIARFLRAHGVTTMTPEAILLFLDDIQAPDVERVRDRLRAGKCPPFEHLQKAVTECSFKTP